MQIKPIVLLVIGPERNWRGMEQSSVEERMKWYEVFMHQLRKYCSTLPVLVINNFKNKPTPEYDYVTIISGHLRLEHSPSLDIGIKYLFENTDYNTVIFMDADCIIFGNQWYHHGIKAIEDYKCVGFHVHKLWLSEVYVEHTSNLIFWNLEYIRDKPMQAYDRLRGSEYDVIHQNLMVFQAILDNKETTDEGKQIQLNRYKYLYDTGQRSIVLAKKDKVFYHVINSKAHDFIHLSHARLYAPDHFTILNRAKIGWKRTAIHPVPIEYGQRYLSLMKELF